MGRYVWCEDSKSGLIFWKEIFKVIHPDVIVETKLNNTRLRKSASKIQDDGNTYYIIIDTALDNTDIIRELEALKKEISGKKNVILVNIPSFEFVMLSFNLLIEWIFAKIDELKNSRRSIIRAKEVFIDLILNGGTVEKMAELKELFPYSVEHNNEQISAELLYQITRNTGFETNKGKLGQCFINNCCEWSLRQSDDICGLDTKRIFAEEKIKLIVNHSILKSVFEEVGL